VRNIFLGKKTKWDNGQQIVIVTLKDSETHKNFLKKYIAKTATQFKSYWKKQVFTGKGSVPKSFEKEEDLLDFVAGTEGAIGYVSSGLNTDAVKTITTN
jgi:ABC-type phosphate transport system substrate-binding protein